MFLVAGNMCRSQTVQFQVEVGFLQCFARKSHGKHHEISWQGALLQIPCGEFLPSWKEVRIGEISLISYLEPGACGKPLSPFFMNPHLGCVRKAPISRNIGGCLIVGFTT
jgi:hypothetical protein